MLYMRQWRKLIVFDADGVLLDNKSGGFKEILMLLGKKKEVLAIDREYQKRKHLGPWGLKELALLLKGFSIETVVKISKDYCVKKLMKGAQETISKLKEKNYTIGSISSNPKFVMDSLKKTLKLDFSCGNELELRKGIATGKILKKVDRYIKAEILKEKMTQYHIKKRNVAVVGDSLTDVPMAELAAIFIAFNAKPEVKESADILIKKKDLREILSYLL